MHSNYDVFRVPAGLKHSWAWEFITDAISPSADRPTKRHILGSIDSDQPIGSIKNFVPSEPETPAYTQKDC
jgi:hypothetical protein